MKQSKYVHPWGPEPMVLDGTVMGRRQAGRHLAGLSPTPITGVGLCCIVGVKKSQPPRPTLFTEPHQGADCTLPLHYLNGLLWPITPWVLVHGWLAVGVVHEQQVEQGTGDEPETLEVMQGILQ